MPFPMGPGQGEGLRGLLMQLLDAAGQLPDQAMGPHAGMMNEGLESFAGGGARGDDVMGAMPMLPPLGKLFGMAGRLRGAGGAYQGTKPIAGSQGVPHTSPLPNQGPPVRGGAPPSGGGYADDAAGLMRGDIPLEQPRMGADFQAMDELRNPLPHDAGGAALDEALNAAYNESMTGGVPQRSPWPSKAHPAIEQGPLSRAGWGQGMVENPENIQMVMDEFAQINASGQVPYEDTIGYLTSKYGDWILDFI